jgi:hypothetical protein
MGSIRSQFIAFGALIFTLIAAAPVLAEDPPPGPPTPPGTPSIDQYVETVPTSSGGASPGVGRPHKRALPANVARTLRTHEDQVTQRLTAIATSSAYGAPQSELHPTAGPKHLQVPRRPEREPANPLSAAVSAVGDAGDSHVFWLLGAMIALTTSMVWAATRHRRV